MPRKRPSIRRAGLIALTVASVFAFFALHSSPTLQADPAINGSIEYNGTQKILNLWGTNYEMGYAHGYLMASEIRDIIDTYLVGTIGYGSVGRYNDFLEAQERYVAWPSQYLEEINGIEAGMAASGKNRYVPSLGRNIEAKDLKALNLLPEFFVYCSSFGVWGNATGDTGTILARNLDFYFDPQGNFVNDQILITYEPNGGRRFASVTWPGMVGVVSGMNEDGVSLTVNMGNDQNSTSSGPFYASLIVFRYILENTNRGSFLTQPLSTVNSVTEFSPFIIQVGTPYNGSTDPVYYLEDSSGQNLIRYADDLPNNDHIIATNHFMKVYPPPSSSEGSVIRYNKISARLANLYSTGDRKVDSAEA
jgi:hypothetical protein